ncbi:aldehyde dehydrogenase [Streptomyces sp. NPDC087856]|uniref:aldehyde dehydrogenase n=1 Tax=Streptomyces sp. NPDC087856 TaxID=3365811 RepID=UPI0037FD4E16
MVSTIPHHIEGKDVPADDGRYLDNVNPWTQEVTATLARGSVADVNAAVEAARRAFDEGPWPRWSEAERSAALHRLADLVNANADVLAAAEAGDMGRPVQSARSIDIPRAADMFRFFGDHAALATGETYPSGADHDAYVAYRPAGVVAAITPWNHPLMLGAWKIAAPLAWGNTVVMKPAESSPTSAYLLAGLAIEAGIPRGVLNVVQGLGSEAGQALTDSAGVDRITFTGSTATGRRVAQAAAGNLVPVTLELGGKGSSIIAPDADIELAADLVSRAVFNNTGQVCLAGTRVLVHEDIRDEFTSRLVARAGAWSIGDPFADGTTLGPLASAEQHRRVRSYYDRVEAEGGAVLCGGPGEGNVFAPTVVSGIDPKGTVAQEEVFGPVATIIGYEGDDQAVTLANDTAYGLTSVLITDSVARIRRMVPRLRSGTVWVNCYQVRDLRAPMGGRGASGIGREGGTFSREFFTEPQAVFIA